MEHDDSCGSQCSCSDSRSCSCSEDEESCRHRDNNTSNDREPSGQEIPPPLEFDTNLYSAGPKFETSVQVEINPCHQITQPEISPTNSEDMKYSAPEADQFYKNFSSYDKYSHSIPHHGGADSATDSAIDMPADGSVSTINEIPPHHSTMISSYHKHTPTVADYSDMQSQSDDSPNDSRSRAIASGMHRPPPPKYLKPTLTHHNGQSKHGGKEQQHPVIYEYQKPPTNRTIDQSESIHLQTFQPSSHANGSAREPYSSRQNGLDLNNKRLEESFTV